jgi:hypothetical protein
MQTRAEDVQIDGRKAVVIRPVQQVGDLAWVGRV